jgi:hypothetical protein
VVLPGDLDLELTPGHPIGDAVGMQVSFVAQPYADGSDLRDFLVTAASDADLDHLDVVVAWAKRSGLRRVRDELEAIRDRPGVTRLLVGIDEGGATRQGLALARDAFSTVHVFHDNSSRTFHPKIYVASGADRAHLLVGSNNLTAGGVYFNYEAAIQFVLELPEDEALLLAVRDFIDRLYADSDVCLELTDQLMAELVSNPRYRVGDEDAGKPKRVAGEDAPEDVDSTAEEDGSPVPGASVFGRSGQPKRPDPAPSPAKAPGAAKTALTKSAVPAAEPILRGHGDGAGAGPATAPGPLPTVPPSGQIVVKRWFKKLSPSDARHPPSAASHVTGVLRLVQADHPIDQTHYFRDDFFAPLPWTGTQRPRGLFEETSVPFRVVVNGIDHGIRQLRVDHAPWREAGQGNHTTVLHWDDVAPVLDAANYTDHYVILERLANGDFHLEITPADPGQAAFIP